MIGGVNRPAGPELHRARDADPDPPQVPRQAVRGPQQPLEQRLHPVEAGLRAGLDPGRLGVVAEDPAVEGGHGDVDAGRAEIGDEDVPGVGAKRQLARRSTAGARPDVTLGDEAALDQLADPLRDDAPARDPSGPPAPSATRTVRGGPRRARRRAHRATRRGSARTRPEARSCASTRGPGRLIRSSARRSVMPAMIRSSATLLHLTWESRMGGAVKSGHASHTCRRPQHEILTRHRSRSS